MDNELGLGNETQGRIFHASVYGNTAIEIEVAALAAAQEFFGDGVPLKVVPDYQVCPVSDRRREEAGKKFTAGVRVRAVTSG